MVDKKTIAFYDSAAERYANLMHRGSPDESLNAFIALLPENARVLDLGCGPARASFHMRAAGLRPDPVDASTGMVETANAAHDIGARLLTFDQIDMVDAYDGVWANFSLLHAPRRDLPRHLQAINVALHDAGIFHIGMKTGEGEARDAIDRQYTYVSRQELVGLVEDAGFDVLTIKEGMEVGCAGTNDPFIIIQARKHA